MPFTTSSFREFLDWTFPHTLENEVSFFRKWFRAILLHGLCPRQVSDPWSRSGEGDGGTLLSEARPKCLVEWGQWPQVPSNCVALGGSAALRGEAWVTEVPVSFVAWWTSTDCAANGNWHKWGPASQPHLLEHSLSNSQLGEEWEMWTSCTSQEDILKLGGRKRGDPVFLAESV